MLKQCIKCHTKKELDQFYKRGSGLYGQCKTCWNLKSKNNYIQNKDKINQQARAWARANPEKAKQSVKKYTEKHAEYRRERAKQYKKDNPVVSKAHELVRNAVRSGKLVKPTCCSNCTRETRLHGHHEDYSKPLEVVWLCQACHWQVHNGTF